MRVAVYFPQDLLTAHSGEYLRTAVLTRYVAEMVDSVVLYSPHVPSVLQDRVIHVPLPGIRPRIVPAAYAAFPTLLSPLIILPQCRSLKQTVCSQHVDIIHAHGHGAGWQTMMMRGSVCAPAAFDVHGILHLLREDLRTRLKDPLRTWLHLHAEKNLFKRVNTVIARNRQEKEFIIEHFNVWAERVYVIPDGVDVDFLGEPVPEATKQAFRIRQEVNGKRVVFFAGWFKKTSGVTDLVKAFRILSARYSDLVLIMAGDGPLMPEVCALIAEHQMLNNVRLLGYISREEFRAYQQISDVVVTPESGGAYNELAPPLKFFECLASGRPCVATQLGCYSGVVQNGVHAILVEPDNPQDMARGIAQLLDSPSALEIGRRGRQLMVDRFSWRESARQAVEVYAEIIARYGRRQTVK